MVVAEVDEVAHPSGWVVGVDGVAAGHVEDGLDDDLVVADPVADLGEGGGAELLDLADGQRGAAVAVDLEVGGLDPDVRLDLRAAGPLGLAGEDADGLDLANTERVGVAVEEQLVGDRTDLVVELL